MSRLLRMKNVPVYIDLAFCLIVLPLLVMIFPIERWLHHFRWYVISYGIWLYALYILNRAVTVPALFRGTGQRTVGFLIILLSLAVTYGFSVVYLYTPKPNFYDMDVARILPLFPQHEQAVWSLYMVVEAFSFAVGLVIQAEEQTERRRQVELERDRAEIALYRAQIKPHFLFNTLNTIYGLLLTHNTKAVEALEEFISMMRYVYTTSRSELVPLSDEADYIRQYVGLQTLRLNGMTDVDLTFDIGNENLMVPPMLLVTFVENCFKHGVSPVDHSSIRISLAEKDGRMTFTTANHIFEAPHASGRGIGVENCRKRLSLLYPGEHTLHMGRDGNEFNVKLIINSLNK